MSSKQGWTRARIDQLLALVEEKLSAEEIAGIMETTRNAVLGKLHRMGKAKPRKPAKRPRQQPKWKPPPQHKDIKLKTKKVEEPTSEPVTLMGLKDHHCRYPLDNGLYCGELAVDFKPYCLYHCKICYAAPPPRKVGRAPRRFKL